MTWVAWRQQRTEVAIAAAILVVAAALLLPTGLQMISAYHHDAISGCLAHQDSPVCGAAVGSFTVRFEHLGNMVSWLTLVPGLVGALLAAPFILDLENGTYRLLWTQSITRRRWVTEKLAMAVAAALLVALALTLLLTWWRAPLVRISGRMDNGVFDLEGIVPLGYALFTLGLALAVGAVWRRAVPTLVVAFAGYFGSRIFVDTWLRERLLAATSKTFHDGGAPPAALNHAWVISQYPSDRAGHPVHAAIGACPPQAGRNCVVQEATGFIHAVYHPASQFWALQGLETALFAGVGLGLLAFAAWWTRARIG
jgi:hypothetical protein